MCFIHISNGISSRSGAEFFGRLTEFMPFDIDAIQTDNGSEYEKEFKMALHAAGVEHYLTYPNCPKQNARLERKSQTSEVKFWNYREGYSVADLNEVASEWNHTYNHVRPHQSLEYLTPAEYLKKWNQVSKHREQVPTM